MSQKIFHLKMTNNHTTPMLYNLNYIIIKIKYSVELCRRLHYIVFAVISASFPSSPPSSPLSSLHCLCIVSVVVFPSSPSSPSSPHHLRRRLHVVSNRHSISSSFNFVSQHLCLKSMIYQMSVIL